MISFVVKEHVLYGYSQKCYLFCCDSGFVLLYSVQVSLPNYMVGIVNMSYIYRVLLLGFGRFYNLTDDSCYV